jgi:hypothetical protein
MPVQRESERRKPLLFVNGHDTHLRARKRHEERGDGDGPEEYAFHNS